MPVAPNAYIHRDVYPLVSTTDTLVIVFRDHGSATARPRIILTAGASDTSVTVSSGADLDIDNFGLTETIALPQFGSQADRPLPISAGASINQVTAVVVGSGEVSVTIESPVPFRSYLRQPFPNPPLS